jgi:hypothetical protein
MYTHWVQKTAEEKEALFAKFMKGMPAKKKTVSSTDGHLTIPKTSKTAKKPGQRKRIKNLLTQKQRQEIWLSVMLHCQTQ